MQCPKCARDVPDSSRFCLACGAEIDFGSTPTLVGDNSPPRAPAQRVPSDPPRQNASPPSSSSGRSSGARFVAGTVIGERYRIVTPLGKGGMGEVYRAEDLTLQHEVALKFLPVTLTNDPDALERFHKEVRIARHVSHPNVCRVFDIGMADGTPFIAMEYVDGEDLAVLLRRIGRFPEDKGLEIARQICAGLSAAHELGLLHRDLKPANVMLDGRGRVRISDFGLASISGEVQGAEIRAGTPAYMAPEQLSGAEVTVKSDIYSLGLVLYEIFTGKRAYDAPTLAELNRVRESSAPASATSLVKDLDPLIERVIQRCMEKDPAKRPSTALQVAAALPGGDPLAAALAAGETPSPEMVAAAGSKSGIRPLFVWSCVFIVALGLIFEFAISGQSRLYRTTGNFKSPELLEERARQILADLGYTNPPADTATGFTVDSNYLDQIERTDKSKTRWANAAKGILFWYRQSQDVMVANQFLTDEVTQGRVAVNDPPLTDPQMVRIYLDSKGRLITFRSVTPIRDSPAKSPAQEPDWNRLLQAAGLDASKCKPTEPRLNSPNFSDARTAWLCTMPDHPETPIQVDAAAYRGRPTFFSETDPPSSTPSATSNVSGLQRRQHVQQIFSVSLLVALLGAGLSLSWINLKRGRGDRKGAVRLAIYVFSSSIICWALGTSHPGFVIPEASSLFMAICWASVASLFLWMMYIALEPFVRRRMPSLLISWTRMLSGQFRDPLVGRDLLVGAAAGLFIQVLGDIKYPLAALSGVAPPTPDSQIIPLLISGRTVFARLISSMNGAIFDALALLLIIVILQQFVRKPWIAASIFVVLLSFRPILGGAPTMDAYVIIPIIFITVSVLLLRFGILALVACNTVGSLMEAPITTQTSPWYAWMGWMGMAILALFVVYSARTALAGQPLFGRKFALDE